MAKKLQIALCGCQGHIEKFGQLINSYPESKVIAAWDRIPVRAEAVADRLGIPAEKDYDRLLSDYGLDGVVIAAENALHKDLVIKAARAGISVFLEKPLCADPADAREMQKAIHESGVKFYMSDPFVRPGHLFVKKLIDEGMLGKITGARVRLGSDAALHPGEDWPLYDKSLSLGGIMADVGGHAIHIAHYLFGMPSALSAMLTRSTQRAKAAGVEENAVVVMLYPDDKLVTLECSWVSSNDILQTEVFGTEGWARVMRRGQEEGGDLVTWRSGAGPTVESYGDALPPDPERHVRYWVEMMANDLPNELVGVEDRSHKGVNVDIAAQFVEIIDAIYRSADGNVVMLP